MVVEATRPPKKPDFEPVTITIKLETPQELVSFCNDNQSTFIFPDILCDELSKWRGKV